MRLFSEKARLFSEKVKNISEEERLFSEEPKCISDQEGLFRFTQDFFSIHHQSFFPTYIIFYKFVYITDKYVSKYI